MKSKINGDLQTEHTATNNRLAPKSAFVLEIEQGEH